MRNRLLLASLFSIALCPMSHAQLLGRIQTTAKSVASHANEKQEEIKQEVQAGKDHLEDLAVKGADHVKVIVENNSKELLQSLANDLAEGKALLIKEFVCTVKSELKNMSASGAFLIDTEYPEKNLLVDISSLIPDNIERKNYSVEFKASFDNANELFKIRVVDSKNPNGETLQTSLSDLGLKADCSAANKIVHLKDGVPQVDSDALLKQINDLSDTKKLISKIKAEVKEQVGTGIKIQ